MKKIDIIICMIVCVSSGAGCSNDDKISNQLDIIQQPQLDNDDFESYYVSKSGSDNADGSKSNPFKTISKAAAVVQPGDTVYIGGGIYAEHSIKPAVSGESDAMIVFRPANSETVTLKHPGVSVSDNTVVFDLTGKDYIRIEGLQFADYKYGKAGILLNHSIGNVIANNRFERLGSAEISAWDANSVIFLWSASKNIISNNFFNGIIGDAIGVNDSAGGNLVIGNTFTNFHGKPRSWAGGNGGSYSSGITCQETKTGDNIFAFNYGASLVNLIWFDRNGSDNIALRNVCHDSKAFIFNESRCARNVIQENIAYNIEGIAYETARYNGTGDTSDTRWVNNVSYNNKCGYYVHKSHRDEFRNNITVESKEYNLVFTAIALQNGPHIFTNNLWHTSGKTHSIEFKGVGTSVSDFGKEVGEVSTMSINPLFTNPSQGDFTLQTSSPARGTGSMGVDLGAYAVYGKTDVGYDKDLPLSKDTEIEFGSIIYTIPRGGSINLVLTLNRIADKPISVDLKPVAGDAKQSTELAFKSRTIEFCAGEKRKTVSVPFQGTAEYDQIVAFRLDNAINAQIGPKNLSLVRVKFY